MGIPTNVVAVSVDQLDDALPFTDCWEAIVLEAYLTQALVAWESEIDWVRLRPLVALEVNEFLLESALVCRHRSAVLIKVLFGDAALINATVHDIDSQWLLPPLETDFHPFSEQLGLLPLRVFPHVLKFVSHFYQVVDTFYAVACFVL